jgi:hypothetical protein
MASLETLERRRRQRGVAHRVLDVSVAEVSLQRSRVVPSVCQRITAGVAKHVRVRLNDSLATSQRKDANR